MNGGTQVIGNTVFNCCIATSTRSLAPAGISISQAQVGVTRPVVSGNCISGMSQGDGVLVTSSPGGALVVGNSINMPSSNAGSGPGGSALLGRGITISSSNNVNADGNTVTQAGAGAGIGVLANGVNCADIVISGGVYATSGIAPALQVTQSGGFRVTRLTVSGGDYAVSNATPAAVNVNAADLVNLTGVTANANTAAALIINGATLVRVSSGRYFTGGTVAIQTTGTCTDTFIDKSANWGSATTSGSLMQAMPWHKASAT